MVDELFLRLLLSFQVLVFLSPYCLYLSLLCRTVGQRIFFFKYSKVAIRMDNKHRVQRFSLQCRLASGEYSTSAESLSSATFAQHFTQNPFMEYQLESIEPNKQETDLKDSTKKDYFYI